MLHSVYHCCVQYFRFIRGIWTQHHEEIISFVFTMLILIEGAMDVLIDKYLMIIQASVYLGLFLWYMFIIISFYRSFSSLSLTPSNRVIHWCVWSCMCLHYMSMYLRYIFSMLVHTFIFWDGFDVPIIFDMIMFYVQIILLYLPEAVAVHWHVKVVCYI